MNERIKELVVESGNGQMRNGKLYPHIGSRTKEDWKKFAELIVRECAIIMVARSCERHGYDKYEDGKAIKQHFGVE